ncbi:MAG: response regulator [Gammaproteobacteria bacterium]
MRDPIPGRGAPPRILILDDDRFMLAVLRDMVTELCDASVRTEADARRALRALRDPAPDLLICDLSMPDMDGIEFMQAAAQAGYRGAIVLLSGMDSGVRMAAEHLARAQGLNVVDTFEKPLGAQQFLEVLAQLQARKGA